MMRNLSSFVAPMAGGALIAMLGAADASAADTRAFIYLAAEPNLCAGATAGCPDEAIASSTGDRIEISDGFGFLTVHPKSISGGGAFSATALEVGGDDVSGTWEAVELLSFKSYGPGDPDPSEAAGFPAGSFQAGLALIRIHLLDDDGDWVAEAILELSCRIPGAQFPPSTEEGVRVNVFGGLNFNIAEDPRATLYIELLP